jgi:hypothetical protein
MTKTHYQIEEITLDDLYKRPYEEHVVLGATRYNTDNEALAHIIIEEAYVDGNRVIIGGHDAESNLMISLSMKEGHATDEDAGIILGFIKQHGSLDDVIRDMSPIEDIVGNIDFYQIDVIEDWIE